MTFDPCPPARKMRNGAVRNGAVRNGPRLVNPPTHLTQPRAENDSDARTQPASRPEILRRLHCLGIARLILDAHQIRNQKLEIEIRRQTDTAKCLFCSAF